MWNVVLAWNTLPRTKILELKRGAKIALTSSGHAEKSRAVKVGVRNLCVVLFQNEIPLRECLLETWNGT